MELGSDSEEDNLEIILEETRKEVISWMKTYGRGIIREWMGDNAKTLLAVDGVTSRKKTLPNNSTPVKLSSKTGSKKAPKLNVTQEIINLE